MWHQAIQNIIISIIIILLVHYIWNYLKDTFSTKKTKDLVNSQVKKYKQIMEEIQTSEKIVPENNLNVTGSLPYISKMEKQTMEDELTQLLTTQ
jgi:hypothetical protein